MYFKEAKSPDEFDNKAFGKAIVWPIFFCLSMLEDL